MCKKLLVLISAVAIMINSCAIFICEPDPCEYEDSRDTIKIIVKEDQNIERNHRTQNDY